MEAVTSRAPVFREVPVSLPGSGVELAGTLALPAGDGSHPAVLLLPGSGEVDRDSDHRRMPLGVTRELAHALAARGVASLRYDKRGVGASRGSYLAAGLSDGTADASSALAWLRSQVAVREDAVVVLGHSEGGYHAVAVASDPAGAGLAGVVLLAVPGTTGRETLDWQGRQVAAALPRAAAALVRFLRVDVVAKQQASIAKLLATTTDVARVGGRKINARWHREFLAFDPVPALRGIRAPVLAVTGGKDIQVNPDDLDVIADTVPGRVDVVRPPDLTHLLRRDPGQPSLGAYKKLVREPVDAELLALVCEWVTERTRPSD